jgi:hypothetical protein
MSSITINGVRIPVATESLRISKENIFPVRRTYRGDSVGWRLQERRILRLRTRPLTRDEAIQYETLITGKATVFPLVSDTMALDGNVPVSVVTANKNFRMPRQYVSASKGTLMARMQLANTTATTTCFAMGTVSDGLGLRISTTAKLELMVGTLNTPTGAGPTSVPLNTPFHVAMTWGNGRVMAYLNGVLQVDLPLTTTVPFDTVTGVPVVDVGSSIAGLTWVRDFAMVPEAYTAPFLAQLGAINVGFVPDYGAPIVTVSGSAINGELLDMDGHIISDELMPWGAAGVFHKDGRVLEIELREY